MKQNDKMINIRFREITKSDDPAVASLVRDNLEAYGLDIPGTAYFDEALDHLSDLYGKDDCRYYVVTDDSDEVIGGVGFSLCTFIKDAAELQKLYLADRAKGAGLGYEMMDFIEDRMRDAGFKVSYLETHSKLETAIHLYEKCGYIEIDRPEQVIHSTMDKFFKKIL